MKIHATLLLLATAMAVATPPRNINVAEECGDLGVMEVDPKDLPEGVTMADVRLCREHPVGKTESPDEEGSLAPWDAVE
jgi:hypothetical protein